MEKVEDSGQRFGAVRMHKPSEIPRELRSKSKASNPQLMEVGREEVHR